MFRIRPARNNNFISAGFIPILNDPLKNYNIFEVKSSMDITIRRLQKADAKEVSSMICRNLLEVNIKDYPEETMQQLAEAYDENKIMLIASCAHSYVACNSGKIIGCGSISSYWGKEDESILLTIFVLPELHGMGIGRKIVECLEADEYFKRAKRIEIPASITACAFYRKLGYNFKNGVSELDDEGHYRLEKFNLSK